jgi:exonuclease VII small subunit
VARSAALAVALDDAANAFEKPIELTKTTQRKIGSSQESVG